MKRALLLLIIFGLALGQENLFGGIFAGYQGWFASPEDGGGIGPSHVKIRDGQFARDNCLFDLWPYSEQYQHKYPAPEFGPGFSMFSSYDYSTVRTHFRWMQENGIHGVFLQRFGSDIRDRGGVVWRFKNKIFQNVMNAARETGRLWSLMYDLSGMRPGDIKSVIMEDFKYLRNTYNFLSDGSYIKHKGRPLVTIWGVGFNDGRAYTLNQCAELVDFLKNGDYGGNSVMVGTPRYWRQGGKDAVSGADLKTLHNILLKADVVSPWTVGRYGTINDLRNDARVYVKADQTWCTQNKLTLMPVIFPGFSWRNLQISTHQPNPGPYSQIPRTQNGLNFFYEQGVQVTKAGARTIYIAMFDQISQGTAIMKCVHVTPSLADGLQFVSVEDDPGFYLKLAGRIGGMIR